MDTQNLKAVLKGDCDLGIITEVDQQDEALTRNLDCIYHRQRLMSNAGKAFFDLLCRHAE